MLEMPIAAALGLIIGLGAAAVGPHVVGGSLALYDEMFPVMSMTGHVVAADSESVTIHITGRKNRGEECRLVSVYGYTFNGSDPPLDAVAERIDKPAEGRIREKGFYDIGRWRVYPVGLNATRVEVWTHHECVGRPILSKIAEVDVKR